MEDVAARCSSTASTCCWPCSASPKASRRDPLCPRDQAAGIPIAAASSSKDADLLLRQVSLDTYVAEKGLTLLDLLDADISGRDLPRGKPDPMMFLVAAEELPATPAGPGDPGEAEILLRSHPRWQQPWLPEEG